MTQPQPCWRGWWWLLAALLAAAAVHAPSLQIGFIGDDFEWWHAGRMAAADPIRLLQPFGGFRLANGWILAVEWLLFGTDPLGYHLTSLLLHLAAGVALWWTLARFSLSPAIRAAAAALWLCSPYSLEPAQMLCERFEPLLLISWLLMAALWPGAGQRWTRGRLVAVVLLALLTLLVKESWVVLPGFVCCYELWLRRVSLLQVARSTAIAGAAVFVYVVIYFVNPPIDASYFSTDPLTISKIPHCWAVFCGLTSLDPSSTQLGAAEAAALLIMATLAWFGWRRRCPLTGIGFALYVLPFAPILTVGFLVSRYTYIPLAGFLMVMVAAAHALVIAVPVGRRPLAAAGLAAVAAVFMAHGQVVLNGDMRDARLRDDAHRELVAEMRRFVAQLDTDAVVVGVRLEAESRNRWLLSRIEGVPKAYFERGRAPYGLIRWAPLLSYALDDRGGPLYEELSAEAAGSATFTVIGHRNGGFVQLEADADTVAEVAAEWSAGGYQVGTCSPWPPR